MAKKNSCIYIRIDSKLKDDAKTVFKSLEITPSYAINLFYEEVVKLNNMPFAFEKKKRKSKVKDKQDLQEKAL